MVRQQCYRRGAAIIMCRFPLGLAVGDAGVVRELADSQVVVVQDFGTAPGLDVVVG